MNDEIQTGARLDDLDIDAMRRSLREDARLLRCAATTYDPHMQRADVRLMYDRFEPRRVRPPDHRRELFPVQIVTRYESLQTGAHEQVGGEFVRDVQAEVADERPGHGEEEDARADCPRRLSPQELTPGATDRGDLPRVHLGQTLRSPAIVRGD